MAPQVLLIGEVFVDVTIASQASEHKMRLGGVVHAARGLWALGVPYSAAICSPHYLKAEIRSYLSYFGCCQVEFFAYVSGSPNVTLIFDSRETSYQGYDIFKALDALGYHNFKIRRPVQENGELPVNAGRNELLNTYLSDLELLLECDLVFAVPNYRDPGTLVEIGLAIGNNIPVIVYDSRNECANTMVISGSFCYSDDLDACLNAVFAIFSSLRNRTRE